MTSRATVTSKGQITIPVEVRKRLGLEMGDQVDFILVDGQTILQPARQQENPFVAFAGAVGSLADEAEVNAWVNELRGED